MQSGWPDPSGPHGPAARLAGGTRPESWSPIDGQIQRGSAESAEQYALLKLLVRAVAVGSYSIVQQVALVIVATQTYLLDLQGLVDAPSAPHHIELGFLLWVMVRSSSSAILRWHPQVALGQTRRKMPGRSGQVWAVRCHSTPSLAHTRSVEGEPSPSHHARV